MMCLKYVGYNLYPACIIIHLKTFTCICFENVSRVTGILRFLFFTPSSSASRKMTCGWVEWTRYEILWIYRQISEHSSNFDMCIGSMFLVLFKFISPFNVLYNRSREKDRYFAFYTINNNQSMMMNMIDHLMIMIGSV